MRIDLRDGSKQVILEGVTMQPDGNYRLAAFSFELSTSERYLAYFNFEDLSLVPPFDFTFAICITALNSA